MFGDNHRGSTDGQQANRGRRMTRETEQFLNRRLSPGTTVRHRAELPRDPRTDPRQRTNGKRIQDDQPGALSGGTVVGTLIAVPADEHGRLGEDLLDRWGLHLSRLIELPHRGHVMLDLSEVKSVPKRFLDVYAWFRRHLASQERRVLLQVNGAQLESPAPEQLATCLKIDETHQ